jgi:hypothetical protein
MVVCGFGWRNSEAGVAKETITRLVDDLDGGVAHETVTFGLDGVSYEIDLSSKNAKKLRGELAGYIEKGTRMAGRRVGGGRAPGGRRRGGARGDREQNQAIREWALGKGYDVAARGRIRQDIVEQFHKTAGR